VLDGRVKVPVLIIDEITGAAENVFTPEIVCVVSVVTKLERFETNAIVPVVVGSVKVPVFTMVEITGAVKVLLISVFVVD
jgi:hypothetical protein